VRESLRDLMSPLLLQEQEWRGETIHETRLLLPPFTV
jgi:hypothetical protein